MAEPPVPEELWEQILLRLPPDDPSSLLRASLVCKQWRNIVYGRRFLRRLGELHRAPPMLGYFQNNARRFNPTTAGSAFSLPVPERDSWPRFLGCRHGRALLVCIAAKEFLVWEPLTGYQRRVPVPTSVDLGLGSFSTAVVCAVDGCDHWACHGGPFRLVFVSSGNGAGSAVLACEYSSETGAWGEPISASHPSPHLRVTMQDSLLLGKSLYFLCNWTEILEYDLDRQVLAVINPPNVMSNRYYYTRIRCIVLMQAEDGGLGIAGIAGSHLALWSRQRIGDNYAGWVLTRVVHLEDDLSASAFPNARERRTFVSGLVEGTNVIFVSRKDGLFRIEPNSGRARKVSSKGKSTMFPFLSFYAPGV